LLRVGRKGNCLQLETTTATTDCGEVFWVVQLILIIENVCGITKKIGHKLSFMPDQF